MSVGPVGCEIWSGAKVGLGDGVGTGVGVGGTLGDGVAPGSALQAEVRPARASAISAKVIFGMPRLTPGRALRFRF
jgi:hypothetical protein